jgi:diketogulonate reductase-like aldo/keto reductase
VQYNLSDRGIEFDLHPRCQKDGIAVMAYCPLGQGRLINTPGIAPIAKKHNVTNSAVALAFTLRLPGMISIPKSSHEKRVLENFAAADLVLDDEDLARLDEIFPPPRKKRPLAMS